jgi:tRNA pseudouridine55 synthase
MYSAKKVEGRKLYELARRGLEVERVAVRVMIHELATVEREGRLLIHKEDQTAELSIRVVCSSGTYVRTLAESIGEALGAPAHLLSLRRTRAGDFGIEDALSLEEVSSKMEESDGIYDLLLPMDAALSGLPFVHLTADEARKALHGIALRLRSDLEAEWLDNQPVRMRDADGHLIAVGFFDVANRSVHPRVVLSPEK